MRPATPRDLILNVFLLFSSCDSSDEDSVGASVPSAALLPEDQVVPGGRALGGGTPPSWPGVTPPDTPLHRETDNVEQFPNRNLAKPISENSGWPFTMRCCLVVVLFLHLLILSQVG